MLETSCGQAPPLKSGDRMVLTNAIQHVEWAILYSAICMATQNEQPLNISSVTSTLAAG